MNVINFFKTYICFIAISVFFYFGDLNLIVNLNETLQNISFLNTKLMVKLTSQLRSFSI